MCVVPAGVFSENKGVFVCLNNVIQPHTQDLIACLTLIISLMEY